MDLGVVDMNAVLGDLDAEIGVAAPVSAISAISPGEFGEWLQVMDLQQPRHSPWAGLRRARAANMRRLAASCSSIVRRVCGLTCTTSTLRIDSSEQIPSSTAVTPTCRRRSIR